MEALRLKYNKNGDNVEVRKQTAKDIQNLLVSYQKDDYAPEPYKYLDYCLEYITPDLDLDKKPKLAIYCGNGWMKWDPNSVKKGISGSEEAVIYASEVLAKKGYQVTIYGCPPENSLYSVSNSNPRYINCSEFIKDSGFDILIVWRCQNFNDWTIGKAKYVYYWLHDIGTHDIPFQVPKQTNGVFFLTDYHRKTYPQIDTSYCIAGNGIKIDHFVPHWNSKRDLYKCIYASNYSRGLNILLYVWPDIRKAVPKATLDIYYGRETYNTLDKTSLNEMIKLIESYKSLGVTEKGKVGHEELAKAMCQASVWTYPCNNYSETFCITATKAQAAGMIPVCTDLGGLKETVNPLSSFIIKNDIKTIAGINEFKNTVISTLMNIEQHEIKRNLCIDFAKNWTWEHVVDKWLELHGEILKL